MSRRCSILENVKDYYLILFNLRNTKSKIYWKQELEMFYEGGISYEVS